MVLPNSYGQERPKVGVVLSGGGARGAAHVGFLQALEAEGIEVDCIVGTSIGALVGGYYAAGWTPAQMLEALEAGVFEQRLGGSAASRYPFKSPMDSPVLMDIRLSSENGMVRSNLIQSFELEWSLMQELAPASASCEGDFNELLVPFRCVGSDVLAKHDTVFAQGDLAQCIRASVAFPFYLPPVWMDGRPIYDGGLYNNVPVDVMLDSFAPDIVLVSAIQSEPVDFGSDDLMSQVEALIVRDPPSVHHEIPVFYVRPEFEGSTLDFSQFQPAVDAGRTATEQMLASEAFVEHRVGAGLDAFQAARQTFVQQLASFELGEVQVQRTPFPDPGMAGLDLSSMSGLDASRVKQNLMLLDADSHIGSILPRAIWNDSTGRFDLDVALALERDLLIALGGSLPSNGTGFGFASLGWQRFGKVPIRTRGSLGFGSFYNVAQVGVRMDFNGELPFAVEAFAHQTKFSYQRTQVTFFEELNPVFLQMKDAEVGVRWLAPTGSDGVFNATWSRMNTEDATYGEWLFDPNDTADVHAFSGHRASVGWVLDRRDSPQFPRSGSLIQAHAHRFGGTSEARFRTPEGTWAETARTEGFLRFRANALAFLPTKTDRVALAVAMDVGLSDELIRSTYRASLAQAHAFQPMLGSRAVFLESFRAYNFVAAGAVADVRLWRNGYLRAEVHAFQPFEGIGDGDKGPLLQPNSPTRWMAGVRLHSKAAIGPLSLGLEYFERERDPWFLELHWGYRIFQSLARR